MGQTNHAEQCRVLIREEQARVQPTVAAAVSVRGILVRVHMNGICTSPRQGVEHNEGCIIPIQEEGASAAAVHDVPAEAFFQELLDGR